MKKTLLLTIALFFGMINALHSQACGEAFTDPAGANANYANNTDYTVTICPTNPGEVVTVTFSVFNIEATWDALYVFNGNSTSAPQISSANAAGNVPGGLAGGFWGTVIPGPFTSTSPDGCLTFRFRSDGTGVREGWVANVTCATPPTCLRPTSLNTSSITSNSAILGWLDNNNATSWECIALPAGSPLPTSNSTGYVNAVTNPYTFTGLASSTCYTFYVRTVCSAADKSDWSVGANVCTGIAPAVCGGQFVDAGGPNLAYNANSNITTTICPTNPGDVVTVTFSSFNTEASWDGLLVYNGNTTSSTQISSANGTGNGALNTLPGAYWGNLTGSNLPGPFTSSSSDGCLTFKFISDGSVQNPGWVANITCGPPPSCAAPNTLSVTGITTTSATLNWAASSSATSWEYVVVPVGAPAPTVDTNGTTITQNTVSVGGLTPISCYTFYVRALCSATDKSSWAGGFNFCTLVPPPACGGQFIDNGGPTANYSNNSDNTTTICPTNPGEIVSVVFNSFDTEATYDALYVFDGNSIAAPQIASSNAASNVSGGLAGGYWGTTIPGPFTSSSPDGCLTFRFRSDNTVNRAGWIANVLCVPSADRIVLLAYVDSNSNGVKDTDEALFPHGAFIYQQNNNGTDINGYSPTGQFALYDTNPANTYSFSYQIQTAYAPYYNSGTTTYSNINIAAGSGTQFLYFPIVSTQRYNDVTISIAPLSVPRPGLTYINKITYRNLGTAATNGTITFAKPAQVTTFTVSQTGTVTNVSGFTYAFTNLLPNETRTFLVTMTVPAAPIVNLNELLTATVSISAPADDIDATNNSASNSQIVVNSFDPNDKMESRGKTIPFNQFAPNDYFFYTIRFQNNGTANAIDVRIEDLLNAQIDEASVLMVSSSHNYTLKRIGNQLVWDFKNIFLTPSTVNENASKGYIQFKVKLKPGFQAGDIIPNNASIYFDTNPAIVTATFNSKFTVPLGISDFDSSSLVVYPNPASNLVQIGLANTTEQINKVVLYDILGKTVKTVSTIGTENLTIDVSDLSRGVYLIEMSTENNLKLTKKLILQ